MPSFSTENLLKAATLQNLDRFLLQSKFLSVTKINEHTLIFQISIDKNCSLYTFSKRNSRRISFPFIRITIFIREEHSIWSLNVAIDNNYHTYNSFIKVYFFSCPVMMSSFHKEKKQKPGLYLQQAGNTLSLNPQLSC